MTATDYTIKDACDGDRRPNAAREYMTVEDCIRAHAQKVGEQE